MSKDSQRYLGLELGGSRRTAYVCLEFSPAQEKIHLFEAKSHLHGTKENTADEVLLAAVNGLNAQAIGVDAPLSFPPCLLCEESTCPGVNECSKESVRWMREESERRHWRKAKFPPPYTHRPIDLLMRGRWQDDAPLTIPAEEAFGSGRAPIAARMSYLKRRLSTKRLLEVNPRFALVGVADWYGISVRELRRSRDLEYGAENRFTILNKLAEKAPIPGIPHLQLYMTDIVSIAKDLSSFDALFCALMPIYGELGLLEEPEIDPAWGFVARPRRLRDLRSKETWGEA